MMSETTNVQRLLRMYGLMKDNNKRMEVSLFSRKGLYRSFSICARNEFRDDFQMKEISRSEVEMDPWLRKSRDDILSNEGIFLRRTVARSELRALLNNIDSWATLEDDVYYQKRWKSILDSDDESAEDVDACMDFDESSIVNEWGFGNSRKRRKKSHLSLKLRDSPP